MNGYQMIADSYRTLLEREKDIDRASIESKIKALDFLATATEEERLELFNSGAFNEVLKAYTEVTLKNCKLDDDTIRQVMGELNYTLDMMTAKEVLKKYRGW